MSKVRVASFSISIDGFGAGARQDLQNPLGVRGPEMFAWFFQTEVWNKMHGQSGGLRGGGKEKAIKKSEEGGGGVPGGKKFVAVGGALAGGFGEGWGGG